MVSKKNFPKLRGWVEYNDGAKVYGEALLIHVWCPYCQVEHTHGIPSRDAKLPSFRVPHCAENINTGHVGFRNSGDYLIDWDPNSKKGIDYKAWANSKLP